MHVPTPWLLGCPSGGCRQLLLFLYAEGLVREGVVSSPAAASTVALMSSLNTMVSSGMCAGRGGGIVFVTLFCVLGMSLCVSVRAMRDVCHCPVPLLTPYHPPALTHPLYLPTPTSPHRPCPRVR